ncbi:MAG: DUF3307 domain-containing protein [Acholeplasma sp.]|nr:DUF3307 domain-containing protein [Acholeplasma sp.]
MNVFILAHFLADFVFQKDNHVIEKNKNVIKGNLKHVLWVSLFFILSAIYYILIRNGIQPKEILLIITFVVSNIIIHFMIDVIKSLTQKRFKDVNLILLIIDQVIHFSIIFISYRILLRGFDEKMITNATVDINLIIYLVIATFVSSVIIKEILILFNLKPKNLEIYNSDLQDIKENLNTTVEVRLGKWIGIIERMIMFMAMLFGIFEVLAIVVAFKTLSRFTDLKDNPEYYILGNLLSLLLVFTSYGLYQGLFKL